MNHIEFIYIPQTRKRQSKFNAFMLWLQLNAYNVFLVMNILHTLISYIFGMNICCLIIIFAVEQMWSVFYLD